MLNLDDIKKFADKEPEPIPSPDPWIYGTPQNDVLAGTANSDRINALESNDIVNAGAGNDLVIGGYGRDTIYGEDGNDTLYGGIGTERLLDGGYNGDQLFGGAGDDILYGGTIGESYTTFYGGSGNDTLYGTSTVNTYYFWHDKYNAGNDLIIEEDNGSRSLLSFVGIDTPVTVDMNATLGQKATWAWGLVNWIGDVIERVQGGNGNDLIIGNIRNNDLLGSLGDDRIYGGEGNDGLQGGYGNDTLYGGLGDDLFQESSNQSNNHNLIIDEGGNEKYFIHGFNNCSDTIADASGTDTLILRRSMTFDASYITDWQAVDGNDADNFVDSLLIQADTYSLLLQDYFSNTSINAGLSIAGAGCIETIQPNDNQNLTFTDILQLVQ
jgi:Ca2+-binding RTX toxin-like protein